MATKVIMPKLSPTMEEGQISRWLKKEGDKVSMGEPLAEIDTDKATMEMQALANGVLRKIVINEGQSAPLGQLIAIIGEPEEDIASLLSEAPAAAAAPATKEAPPEQAAPAPPPPASWRQTMPSPSRLLLLPRNSRRRKPRPRLPVSAMAARRRALLGLRDE